MPTKSRKWVSLLIWLSSLMLALFPGSIAGYRLGVLDLQLTFSLLGVVAVGGGVLLLVSVCLAIAGKLKADKMLMRSAMISIAIVAFPVVTMGLQIIKATSVPPIHDITTDTIDPPAFDLAVQLRGEGANTLAYGSEELPAAELARLQTAAYPGIKTLFSELSVDMAFDRALEVTRGKGLEVINEDRENGLIEAVATTFWFGFKDDLAIRIRANGSGSRIDFRSVSRLGKSDLGANAKRIAGIMEAFNRQ